MKGTGKIRVLVVDDSAVARELITKGLSRYPDIEVAGTASDAWSARDKIVLLNPDVVTLDIEMPRMDGIEFLKKLLPQYPLPVVVVSAVTPRGSERALAALEAGALDIVAKPEGRDHRGLEHMLVQLSERIREASRADVSKARTPAPKAAAAGQKPSPAGAGLTGSRKVIVIGASTGGTQVLNRIIPEFPLDMPGTVIVQHMPPVFTRMFADTLDRTSAVEVREAKDGDVLRSGLVLVAPGDLHLRVVRHGVQWKVSCSPGDKVSGHRPSVDVLFDSAAESAGNQAVALLLTGMGADGARGLLKVRGAGGRCFAQNEESSVVFGMPGEAWKMGAPERLLSIEEMTATLIASCAAGTAKAERSALSQSIR